jgi:hypothetical protein
MVSDYIKRVLIYKKYIESIINRNFYFNLFIDYLKRTLHLNLAIKVKLKSKSKNLVIKVPTTRDKYQLEYR